MNWKNRLWQFFLAIVVGATLSVCNSAMDTNNFEAIAGSISDGSDQGYMRIGNMQIVWGKTDRNWSGNVTFPKAFSETPVATNGAGCNIYTNVSSTGFTTSGCTDPIQYLIVGKWQ